MDGVLGFWGPVDAVVVDIPFKESYNANTREVVKG